MKIEFGDGSFVSIEKMNDKIELIMCGLQRMGKLTMSSAQLTVEQAEEMFRFLENLLKKD